MSGDEALRRFDNRILLRDIEALRRDIRESAGQCSNRELDAVFSYLERGCNLMAAVLSAQTRNIE